MNPMATICLHGPHIVPCKVPMMHAHCLQDPMHTLLLPISRNSILLLRPNHQILFPGNFYPFMWLYNVCDEDESNVAEQITEKKKIQSFPFSVSGYFPRFHKQVLRSGKQHIEREMEGRRRKLDEKKKRGVYGVIIQPPPKKEPVFLLFLRLSRLSFPRRQI